jgi:hypothetical protein
VTWHEPQFGGGLKNGGAVTFGFWLPPGAVVGCGTVAVFTDVLGRATAALVRGGVDVLVGAGTFAFGLTSERPPELT